MNIHTLNKLIRLCCILIPAMFSNIVIVNPETAFSQTKKRTTEKKASITYDLIRLQESFSEHIKAASPKTFEPRSKLLRIVDTRVVIDAVASDDASALLVDLETLGLQKGATYGRMISGQFPIDAIDKLESLSSLRFVRPAYVTTHAGLVDSQGDIALRADIARAIFGLDGSGVTIGTLSDSFDDLGGAADDVASGDLPAGINVLTDLGQGGSDEGRAMMQLIHDVAPGVDQAFTTAFNGQAAFAQGILDLAAAGADVIVDDVIYFAEAMFQDDNVAQVVDQVKAAEVAYFSSAGNSDRKSYESTFTPGPSFAPSEFSTITDFDEMAPTFQGGTAHDFGGGDAFQSITISEGSGFTISFQWDEPFFSISGAPGTSNEVDIYILNNPPSSVIGGSAFSNFGGDAVEIFEFTNFEGSGRTEFNIMIVNNTNVAGQAPGFIKYVRFDQGSVTINEFDTASSTLYGHANAAGAEAVGASAYFRTPEFGVDPPLLNSSSAAGSTQVFFDTQGTRFANPEIRNKPEIVAADGGNTTFFGSDFEADGFPNFFGTSAAAPHAAAVAALLLQADGSLTPEDIYSTLESTAIDMNDPGFDFDTGFGLIQADDALATVAGAPTSAGLGNFVWQDANADGVQDPVEPGVAGITVELLTSGGVVASATTNALGLFSFSALTPGDYSLAFSLPSIYSFTVQDVNGDSSDSDVDPSTGETDVFTLAGGTVDKTRDAGLIFNPANAEPGIVYALTGKRDGANFLTINQATGAGSLVGSTGLPGAPGLAINSNGEIFGTNSGSNGNLYRIDAVTGTAGLVAPTELRFVDALAFNENDILYGVDVSGDLSIIATATGDTTFIGNTGEFIKGLAFDPTDGTLWASAGGGQFAAAPDGIYTIDDATGVATLVGTTGLGGSTPDLFFDVAGNLFGVKNPGGGQAGNSSELILIDKATAAGTVIGEVNFASVSGLAAFKQLQSGAQISVTPQNVDFGEVMVDGTVSPKKVIISNVGAAELTISNISNPGSSFNITNLPDIPVVLLPAGSATFDVEFAPTSSGEANGTITIISDDTDDTSFDVFLTGFGFQLNRATLGACYASTGLTDGGRILTIEPATGAGTLVGATGLTAAPGLAINSQGEIFATDATDNTGLYRIDATTGIALFVANTGLLFVDAIAFGSNDLLYGINSNNDLYIIDAATGETSLIGPTGDFMQGMAFDPTDGSLWASTGAGQNAVVPDGIYTIDVNSGAASLVGVTGLGGSTPDIHFDENGNLYGVKGGGQSENQLISIDKSTGTGMVIGSIGFTAVSGLAYRFNSPPGNFTLVDPPNEAVLDTLNPTLTWEKATDPDSGDTVTYDVIVSTQSDFSDTLLLEVGLTDTMYTIVSGLEVSKQYYWKVIAKDIVGATTVNEMSFTFSTSDVATEVDNQVTALIPTKFALFPNYPNPFNPETRIRYDLPKPVHVRLEVFNILGQKIRTLIDETKPAGAFTAVWEGLTDNGEQVVSGVYIYYLKTEEFKMNRKMLLLK